MKLLALLAVALVGGGGSHRGEHRGAAFQGPPAAAVQTQPARAQAAPPPAAASQAAPQPAQAAPPASPCNSTAVSVNQAHLFALIDPAAGRTILVLSGKATVSGAPIAAPVQAICAAATGNALKYDGREVCSEFAPGGYLTGNDRVSTVGQDVGFSFVTQELRDTLSFVVEKAPGGDICTNTLDFTVRPATGYRLGRLYHMPRSFAAQSALLIFTKGADPGRSRWYQGVVNSLTPPATSKPVWDVVLRDALAALAPLLLFQLWRARSLALSPGVDPWRLGGWPILTSSALLLSGTLLQAGERLSGDLIGPFLRTSGRLRGSFNIEQTGLTILAMTVVLSAIYMLWRLLSGLLYKRPGPLQDIPLVLASASAVALVMTGFAGGATWAAGAWARSAAGSSAWPALPDALPALVVSAALATIALLSIGRTRPIGAMTATAIVLVLVSTVLYPYGAIIRGPAAVGENTFFWAYAMVRPISALLICGGFVALGYRLIGEKGLSPAVLRRGLAALMVLDMVGFNSRSILDVAGGAVIVLAGPYLLFSRREEAADAADSAASAATDTRPTGGSPTPFSLMTGASSAGVFLVQSYFAPHPLVVQATEGLQLVGVIEAFATGLLAGLLFCHARPVLRGHNAAVKAITVSAYLLAASFATSLDSLMSAGILRPLAGNLGVVAALIVCAIMFFDLRMAPAADGKLDWPKFVSGSILTHVVPTISAILLALYSALSPILESEMKTAFSSALNLKAQASTNAAADATNVNISDNIP